MPVLKISRCSYNTNAVNCPLCGQRKARRSCPALQQNICPVCCGTKRLTEIPCPADCGYLATAREHPPAVLVRQQQRDVTLFVQLMREFSERQSQLFLMAGAVLVRYQAPELQPLIDSDVAEAAAALAATFETAVRGVIYEHRPASPPAERLTVALKRLFAEAQAQSGSAFERDAAVVLRRIEEGVSTIRALEPEGQRPFLDLLGRLIRKSDPATNVSEKSEEPRLIVP